MSIITTTKTFDRMTERVLFFVQEEREERWRTQVSERPINHVNMNQDDPVSRLLMQIFGPELINSFIWNWHLKIKSELK